MNTTTEITGRTIEQILDIRIRAAQLRILERATALVSELDPGNVANPITAERRAKLVEAKQLADEALVLAQREADSQKGLDVEAVQYDPSTSFALRRYAAVLIEDNPELDPVEAMHQAHQDERVRFDDWFARYGEDDDLGDDEE